MGRAASPQTISLADGALTMTSFALVGQLLERAVIRRTYSGRHFSSAHFFGTSAQLLHGAFRRTSALHFRSTWAQYFAVQRAHNPALHRPKTHILHRPKTLFIGLNFVFRFSSTLVRLPRTSAAFSDSVRGRGATTSHFLSTSSSLGRHSPTSDCVVSFASYHNTY